MKIGNGHVCLSGQTQYGKSYRAKLLFFRYPKAVFYDLKHDPNHEELRKKCGVIKTLRGLKNAIKKDDCHIVYQPPYLDYDGAVQHFDDVCAIIFKHGNITLFNDEAAGVTKSAGIGHWFFVLMTQGLSRGCNVVNITQRPTACHNAIISQSDYFLLFRHNVKTDRDKLEGVVGDSAGLTETLEKYHFVFVHPDRSYDVCLPGSR